MEHESFLHDMVIFLQNTAGSKGIICNLLDALMTFSTEGSRGS